MSDEKKALGRPPRLTPEIQTQIVEMLSAGAYLDTAAEAVGVGTSTLYDWIRWGKRGTQPYADFSEAVTRARAQAEVVLVATARTGDEPGVSNGPAKCAQWLLERTRGTRYAARVNVKVEEELEGLLDVVERLCATKDCGCYEAILAAIAARSRGEEAPEIQSGESEPAVH